MTAGRSPEHAFVVLDASVWVARLVPQDEFHAVVKAWMENQRAAGVRFISPAILLAEAGGAIARRTGDPALGRKAIAQLEDLPGIRLIEMDNELVHDAAILAAELGLCGADSLYVAAAARLGLPLATYDSEQRERAKGRVTVAQIENQSK